MTMKRSGSWAPRRPPDGAVDAARRAFHERSAPGTRRVDLVFDSLAADGRTPVGAARILMFSGEDLAALVTSVRVPEGNRVGGAIFARTASVALAIRRPKWATIELSCTADGRLLPTTVPSGPASLFARDREAGRIWQSDWLTL
jgi:hypothetical protein